MASNHNAEEVGLPDKVAVLKSREQLRRIPDYMVPRGVVHSAEILVNGNTSWLASLDGENFVDALADPSDWTPDMAADVIAGVGTCLLPSVFTREFLQALVAQSDGSIEFNVIHDEGGPNTK